MISEVTTELYIVLTIAIGYLVHTESPREALLIFAVILLSAFSVVVVYTEPGFVWKLWKTYQHLPPTIYDNAYMT